MTLGKVFTDKASAKVEAGEKKALLAREFGISRDTVYQYLRSDPS